MRTLLALALLALSACAATPVIDKETGTTLAERCVYYRMQHESDKLAVESAQTAVDSGMASGLNEDEMNNLRLGLSAAKLALSFTEAQLLRCPTEGVPSIEAVP